ncbi:MAG: tRNA(Met) cytidine acetyltransferase, partial [Oceanicoccus sp.]
MVDNTAVLVSMNEQHKVGVAQRQRRMVVLSGDQQWIRSIVNQWHEQHHFPRAIAVGAEDFQGSKISCIDKKQAGRLLGQDIDSLFYDAWSGLDPDALAISVGALSGGGLFILGVPVFADWESFKDPDYQRILVHPFSQIDLTRRFLKFVQLSVNAAFDALIIEIGKAPELINARKISVDKHKKLETVANLPILAGLTQYRTLDQQKAVNAVCKVAIGRSRRPLVIKSDRGRGKSSALGIASGILLKKKGTNIIVTALIAGSVVQVFERCSNMLNVDTANGRLHFGDSSLLYIPPDELIRNVHKADLLLVDEAAAIPAAMLEQLLKRYNRIVFATTVHGYEGTGRGFDIRFKRVLDTMTPQWKNIQLKQAIRWEDDDPVERWLFDALLLDAEMADENSLLEVTAEHCFTEVLDRDELLDDHACLSQLFGLLVLAHYQTTAADLRSVLDGPNIKVWVTRFKGQVIATAVVAEEGKFSEDLSHAIWKGERRPRGHLIPQTLCYHSGYQGAAELSYHRIIRIAVHPTLQRLGLGGQLIKSITREARDQQIDFVGSSFAATADVLAFWRNSECGPVRLGFSKDASSGCHSALVLRALSPAAEELFVIARQRFDQQFFHELPVIFNDLD